MKIRKNGTVLSVDGDTLKFYRFGRPSNVPPLVADIIGSHTEYNLWYIDCSECADPLTYFSIKPYPHVWVTATMAVGFQRVFKVPSEWHEGSCYVSDLKYAEEGLQLYCSEGTIMSKDGRIEFEPRKLSPLDIKQVVGYAFYGSVQCPVWVEKIPEPVEEPTQEPAEDPEAEPEVAVPVSEPVEGEPKSADVELDIDQLEDSEDFLDEPAEPEEVKEEPQVKDESQPEEQSHRGPYFGDPKIPYADFDIDKWRAANQQDEPETQSTSTEDPEPIPDEPKVDVEIIQPEDAPVVMRRNAVVGEVPNTPPVVPESKPAPTPIEVTVKTEAPTQLRPAAKPTNTEVVEWGGIRMFVFKDFVSDMSPILANPNYDIYRFDNNLSSNAMLACLSRGYIVGFHAQFKYLMVSSILGPLNGSRRDIVQRYPDQRPRTVPRYLIGTSINM